MSEFEWNTEEDPRWDETEQPSPRPPRPTGGRSWLLLVVAALVFVATAASIFRQVRTRVSEATTSTEETVRSAFLLVHQTAERADREVLMTMLSGRDRAWTATQQMLVGSGDLFDRAPWRLALQDGPPRAVAVTLAPDLRSAQVSAEFTYAIDVGNGLTETVTLTQLAAFRRGDDRWLYAPFEADFWGATDLRRDGQHLTFTYPERDEALVTRLLRDLDPYLSSLCDSERNTTCTSGLRVSVDLAVDPIHFVDLSPLNLNEQSYTRLVLPTPTLVGLPTDDASYQALLRGYAALILYPSIAQLTDFDCCDRAGIFQALADRQMTQLGLQAWPMTVAAFNRVDDSGLRLDERDLDWYTEDVTALSAEERLATYALAEFALDRATPSRPLTLIAALDVPGLRIRDWLVRVNAYLPGSGRDLHQEWTRYIDRRAYVTLPPPVPLPVRDVVASCREVTVTGDTVGRRQVLLRYDWGSRQWQTFYEPEDDRSLFFAALPQTRGLVVSAEALGGTNQTVLSVVTDDQVQTLVTSERESGLVYWGQSDPAGERLLVNRFGSADSDQFPFALINWQQCLGGDCAPQPLSGPPTWSPDGRYMLVSDFPFTFDEFAADRQPVVIPTRLVQADGPVLRDVVSSVVVTNPFLFPAKSIWLDNEQFLVIEHVESGPADAPQLTQRLLQGSVTSSDLLPVLPPETVRPLLAAHADAPLDDLTVMFTSMTRSDGNPDMVYLVAVATQMPSLEEITGAFLVRYNWRTQAADVLLTSDMLLGFSLYWLELEPSPDGRFLQAFNFNDSPQLQLIDVETGRMLPLDMEIGPFANWQPEGDWLLESGLEYVRLLVPAQDYELRLETPGYQCELTAWLAP